MRWVRRSRMGVLLAAAVLFAVSCQKTEEQTLLKGDETAAGEVSTPNDSSAMATVTIAGGTEIHVRLVDALGSATSYTGDAFEATMDAPVVVDNWVAVPKGAKVIGRVTMAQASGRLKTPAQLAITLTSVEADGHVYDLSTSTYSREAASHAKRNAALIGGGAAGGAVLGAAIGGKKGAAIGVGAGAGGGTATAYATGKKDIVLPSETRISFKLRRPLTIARTT